jgi:hypothetical protein
MLYRLLWRIFLLYAYACQAGYGACMQGGVGLGEARTRAVGLGTLTAGRLPVKSLLESCKVCTLVILLQTCKATHACVSTRTCAVSHTAREPQCKSHSTMQENPACMAIIQHPMHMHIRTSDNTTKQQHCLHRGVGHGEACTRRDTRHPHRGQVACELVVGNIKALHVRHLAPNLQGHTRVCEHTHMCCQPRLCTREPTRKRHDTMQSLHVWR